MSQDVKSYTNWKALPPLGGGVWVAMVTEVLDSEEIPNLVQTDLSSGGLGVVTGTETLGKGWRIKVPEEFYSRAIEIHESIMGGDHATEPAEETDDPAL